MKNLFTVIAFLCCAVLAHAATSITTPSVSGHWTLAGSPYKIYNNIQVDASTCLTIDAGVNVIFQGPYSLKVKGLMVAVGTASQQINFTIADTTGWSTDLVTSAGGWHGIQFDIYYWTAPDTSAMQYCNITNVKVDSVANSQDCAPLIVYRPFTVKNCNIFHNKANINIAEHAGNFVSLNGGAMEVGYCNFYDNDFPSALTVFHSTAYGGHSYFHDNKIYNNSSNITMRVAGKNVQITNNEFYGNTANDGVIDIVESTNPMGSGMLFPQMKLTGNKIHHNTCSRSAALHGEGGFVDIVGNLVCNNKHTVPGPCGILYGGGGMFLESTSSDSSLYNVRDNVIANNYSADFGGGIEIFQSNAVIANNQIINNKAGSGGAIYVFDAPSISDSAFVSIRNNIFANNVSTTGTGLPDSTISLWVGQASAIRFDHNWVQHPFYQDHFAAVPFTLVGDTTTDITGATPGLIAPTLTTDVTEDATAANFGLLSSSACVDHGDATGLTIDSVDYAGNVRVYGSTIDIGAYEYHPVSGTLGTAAAPLARAINVYPNPASSEVFIATPEAKGVIMLMDVSGKRIAESPVSSLLTSIDIHTIPHGLYFAIWDDGNGGKAVQRVVVE